MPRIAGVNIPDNKRIAISLTYIYGIGHSLSRKILAEAKIDPQKRASQLNSQEISLLKEIIENNKEQIEFSKKLVTIEQHVPVDLNETALTLEVPDPVKLIFHLVFRAFFCFVG